VGTIVNELNIEAADHRHRLEHLALQLAHYVPGRFAGSCGINREDQTSPRTGRQVTSSRRALARNASISARLEVGEGRMLSHFQTRWYGQGMKRSSFAEQKLPDAL
jgi:hypothetical protein